MRHPLRLLVLLVAGAASLATSNYDIEIGTKGMGWSGLASGALVTPRVLAGQRYRGTATFRGETPKNADGYIHVRYTQTPIDAAAPQVLIELFEADGTLISSERVDDPHTALVISLPGQSLQAGTPFEFSYVVEFELLSGFTGATMRFDAEAEGGGSAGEKQELLIEAEMVGEFVEVPADTGDTGDTAGTADTADTDDTGDTGDTRDTADTAASP